MPCTSLPSAGCAAAATLAYVQRRQAEGKTDCEIRRCIKRYLARHFYRALSNGTLATLDRHRSVRSDGDQR